MVNSLGYATNTKGLVASSSVCSPGTCFVNQLAWNSEIWLPPLPTAGIKEMHHQGQCLTHVLERIHTLCAFYKLKKKLIVHNCVQVFAHKRKYLWKPEEDTESSGPEVTGAHEPLNMGARTPTHIL